MLSSDWLHEVFLGVLVRSSNQWSSIRSFGIYQLTKDIGEWLLNIVDWLKLDINIVGCRLNGLVVKRSRARLISPEFESREAESWMQTAEESHNRMKQSSSAFRFSIVI